MRVTPWVERQLAAFSGLKGRTITAWTGVEMAFREEPDGHWQFTDPRVPCLQLLSLRGIHDEASACIVTTYQNDTEFGLSLEATIGLWDPWLGSDGYRDRSLDELPSGNVSDVVVTLSEVGDVAEVRLTLGEVGLLLFAGEVHDQPGGGLGFGRCDESVLVFTDPADADLIDWMPARTATA